MFLFDIWVRLGFRVSVCRFGSKVFGFVFLYVSEFFQFVRFDQVSKKRHG